MRRIQRPSRPLRFLPLRTPPRTAAGFFPPHRPAARLTADGRRRVETYRLLACRVAWRFARRNARDVPTDELVAEALYALTYAAGLYDANRDVPFGAYAYRVIRHCLIQTARRWRRRRRLELPARWLPDDGVWDPADRGPAPDPAGRATARELCERVRQALPAKMYEVLYLYHGEGHTLSEVGALVGLSGVRARQLVVRAVERVRERFADGNL